MSRARCLAVLTCSPELLHIKCRTAEEMKLVNALCRLVEMAINETPKTDTHAMRRLELVLGAARDAHDLVADEKPAEAAVRLRSVL